MPAPTQQPSLTRHWLSARITRHWPLLRLLLLPVIVLLAYLAHRSFARLNGTAGTLRIIAATGLFVLVTRPAPLAPLEVIAPRPQLARGWRLNIGPALLFTSLVMFWLSFRLFYSLKPGQIPDQTPWQYFTLGLVTLALGGWLLTLPAPTAIKIRSWHGLLLAGVLGLALFLRLYLLEQMPFALWYDEALNGLEARRMLHEPIYRPIFVINMTQFHLWLYKTALAWFGDKDPVALRLTSVAFGVATVAAAYRVGSLLRGPWFGLLMAFFLAIMRWAFNFSRIAMTGIETAFFTLLAFYFLVRLVRYRRWRDALCLGLTLGFGLWFYASFRFMLVPLALYALAKTRFWQPRIIVLGLITALVAALTLLPLLLYIKNNTDDYLARSRQVNVFNAQNRETSDLRAALQHSFKRHLGMFHLHGDDNGRHNLPQAPMLDPVMGILMIFGLGLALRNFRQPEEWFFILLLIWGLVPGLVTYEFEAPQALRTIGVISAVAYFCALAIHSSARFCLQTRSTRPLLAGLLALLPLSLYNNYDTYFNAQRHNYMVWVSFQSISAAVAQEAARRPPETQLYFSPLISYEVNAHFTNPELEARQQPLTLPDVFPLRLEPSAPAAVFLDYNDTWLLAYARKIYPSAHYQIMRSRDYGIQYDVPVFYVVDLSVQDLAGVQGLADDGTGVLYIPEYGDYRLSVPRGATLYLDNQPVESEEKILPLAVGNHALAISPPVGILEWRRPGEHTFSPVPHHYLYHAPVQAEGLLARFYANASWQDLPVLQRIDPALDMYFHHLPMPRPYSVIWSGWLRIDTGGLYTFSLRAVEWAELHINGEVILTTVQANEPFITQLELPRGAYNIEVRYQDTTPFSRIHLLWQPPGATRFVTLPPEVLRPTSKLLE